MKHYKYFFCTVVSAFLGTAFLYFSALFVLAPHIRTASSWLEDIIFVKKFLLQNSKSPKVILISGSNSLFGIDGMQMEKVIGRPVVNLGLHAMLPLEFYLYLIKDSINEGDLIVLPLELDYYSRTVCYNKESFAFLVENYPDFCWEMTNRDFKWHPAFYSYDYMKKLPVKLVKVIMGYDGCHFVGGCAKKRFAKAISEWTPKEALLKDRDTYSARNLSAGGCFLFDAKARGSAFAEISCPTNISRQFCSIYHEFRCLVQGKGANLVLMWPVLIDDVRNEDLLMLRSRLMAHGFDIIGDMEEFKHKRELFYDMHYHLNAAGNALHSMTAAQCIKEYLKHIELQEAN